MARRQRGWSHVVTWRSRVLATASLVLALSLGAAACGNSTTALPTSSSPGSTTGQHGTTGHHGTSTTPTTHAPGTSTTTTPAAADSCDISAVLEIAGESTSADESRTASWTVKQQNNWTIFLPSSSWTISTSTAGGADAYSPDGGLSSAGLTVIDSLSPVTYSEESQQILGQVSDVKPVCQSQNAVDANGESQAFEVTGVYAHNGVQEPVHIVYAITISAVSPGSEFHGGEIRLIYGPDSEWSTSLAQELWLIIKRAIFVPSEG